MTSQTYRQDSVPVPSSPESQPLVSVVMLSYNRPRFFAEALESVARQSYPNLEVVVVDNPSDASPEIADLAGRYPQVKLIRNAENVGFATGMNVGMEHASGDYIYLTEDDIVLEPDCIRQLVLHALAEPSLGLISGLMYNKQAGTIRCAGGGLTLGSIFKMEVFGEGQKDSGQFPRPFEVAYIPGAMVFASRELWKSLGGFRDDFFMYMEDVELCLRARRRGHRITIVPNAKVLHFEPPPSQASETLTFHKLKNIFSVYVLYAPLPVLIAALGRQLMLDLPRLMFTNRRMAALQLRALGVTWARRDELWRQRRTAWKLQAATVTHA